MSALPGISRRSWWRTKKAETISSGLLALGVSICSLWGALSKDGFTSPNVASLILSFCLVAHLIYRFFVAAADDRDHPTASSPDDLLAVMHVLYERVRRAHNGALRPERFRMTLHRVDGEELEHLVDYVGGIPSSNGKPGRRFNRRSGMIGRAAISGNPVVAERVSEDPEAFIEEMAATWHIPREEAIQLKHDRKSWMAVPIKNKQGSVIAVIFADSNDKNFFDDTMKKSMIECAEDVRVFVDARYGSEE